MEVLQLLEVGQNIPLPESHFREISWDKLAHLQSIYQTELGQNVPVLFNQPHIYNKIGVTFL